MGAAPGFGGAEGTLLLWASAIALSVASACQRGAESPDAYAATNEAISRALDAHAQAALQRDVAAGVSIFTHDVRLMFPGTPDVRGRDSVAALMKRAWPAINPTALRYQTDEVHLLGDQAVSITRYWVTLAPPGQPVVQDSGRYMFLWQRQADGAWQIRRAVTNSMAPPAP
jgi:uncharacterized protein (TIGR02246 family)